MFSTSPYLFYIFFSSNTASGLLNIENGQPITSPAFEDAKIAYNCKVEIFYIFSVDLLCHVFHSKKSEVKCISPKQNSKSMAKVGNVPALCR